ncbi:tripartite tricarboxylate transporter permease [Chelatococcus asaccharovorans]|uniref:tripartite tricarboxylate transporter permease n=1 Tax=Chelatococcus asaccharovorans TaxID=28210 RepID=UPI00224C649A|nr:tripartite tricarboxylate transporter permease [Chelatococcus asaccharovorans]CAH1658150.1 membrane hypothetical protein [Chelatococcus asaccharovorans]CAH1688821.1 membrane hypothetical protein [Chelatococcus asaccharovorans]
MLTLGTPSNPVMALMIGAMMIQGIQPGPELISNQPKLFWGLIVSMWIGNVMLVVLNLPLVGLWVRMASIPYRFLFPAIVMFASIGVYSVSLSGFDVGLMVLFGLVGYALSKFHYEPTPLLLGFVLGPSLEEYFRKAMILANGDALIFLEKPISAGLLLAAALLLAIILLPSVLRSRDQIFVED